MTAEKSTEEGNGVACAESLYLHYNPGGDPTGLLMGHQTIQRRSPMPELYGCQYWNTGDIYPNTEES